MDWVFGILRQNNAQDHLILDLRTLPIFLGYIKDTNVFVEGVIQIILKALLMCPFGDIYLYVVKRDWVDVYR